MLEEAGVSAGPLTLIANVDSIHHDAAGRVRFHYTILDFAGLWLHGEPNAGTDVTDAAFFRFDQLDELGLWSEAHRVIRLARQALQANSSQA